MHLRCILGCLVLFAASFALANTQDEPGALVDPFVGTSGTKIGGPIDTFPGADAPFGMVQFSPDTPTQPAGGGYDYKDSSITWFSLDHLSGPGCGVFGDFGVLPVVGAQADPAHVKQPFSHSDESASPGYYAVTLGRERIRTELTAGLRSGIARFTFPPSKDAEILINAATSEAGTNDSAIRIVSPTQVEGWVTSGQFCGMPNVYTVYFAAQFDRPMSRSGVWGGGHGTQDGAWGRFDATSRNTLVARFALSWVNQAGAWANLRAGVSDFDSQRRQTAQSLERVLGARAHNRRNRRRRAHVLYRALSFTAASERFQRRRWQVPGVRRRSAQRAPGTFGVCEFLRLGHLPHRDAARGADCAARGRRHDAIAPGRAAAGRLASQMAGRERVQRRDGRRSCADHLGRILCIRCARLRSARCAARDDQECNRRFLAAGPRLVSSAPCRRRVYVARLRGQYAYDQRLARSERRIVDVGVLGGRLFRGAVRQVDRKHVRLPRFHGSIATLARRLRHAAPD